MIQLLLRAKHWQLFIILFGLPVGIYVLLIIQLIASAQRGGSMPTSVLSAGAVLIIIFIIVIVTMIAWFWSIGVGLQEKISEPYKLKTAFFKVCLFAPYALSIFVMLFALSGDAFLLSPGLMIAVILPMQLFAMVAMLYNLYFTAKTIRTAELQRRVSFSDFAGEFFLIWFYPIGIWFIQPRLNRLIETDPQGIKVVRPGFEDTLD